MKRSNEIKTSDRSFPTDAGKSKKVSNRIQKILDDKDAIKGFFEGDISEKELDERGIKFVEAL